MKTIKSCYIHIPFCKSICSYCDFCKFYYQESLVDKYIIALLEEIKTRYQNEILETIYIGGGTPSSLTILQLEKLLDGLKLLKVSNNLEFTIECNIQDITEEKLKLFQKYGINRLSIGVESFHQEILTFLERNYTKKDIIYKITLAKKYFENINIDFIYAVPGENIEMVQEDIDTFLKLKVPHISTYSLMIEEHTKLGIKKIEPISEEEDRKMYEFIEKSLLKHGYYHYEISNYARNGYFSKHNLTYWKNKEYYGFGIGASGYVNDIRYTNHKNIHKYLASDYILEEEKMTPSIIASNYAILGLRTLHGVSKKEFLQEFQKDFIDYFGVRSLLEEKVILENETSYYLNPKYWYVSNEILVKFV